MNEHSDAKHKGKTSVCGGIGVELI